MHARRDRTVLAAILAVALAIRLWHLATVPGVINGDEAGSIVHSLQILLGKTQGVFTLTHDLSVSYVAFMLRALCVRLVGMDRALLGVRLAAALLSVLALIPFFAILRRRTSLATAGLMTLALSCNTWYLNFSRLSWIAVDSILAGLCLLYFVERLTHNGTGVDAVLVGLFAAWALYSYSGGRIYLLAAALTMAVWLARRHGEPLGSKLAKAGLGAALALALFLPQLTAIARHWPAYTLRARSLYAWAPHPAGTKGSYYGHQPGEAGAILLHQVSYSLRGFLLFDPRISAEGPENARLLPPRHPAVSAPIQFLFWLGLGIALWRRKGNLSWWLVYGLNIVLLQVPSVFVPSWSRGLGALPIIYLFAGLAVEEIYARARGRWSAWARTAAAVAILCVALSDVALYWRWATSAAFAAAQQPAMPVQAEPAWQRAQVDAIQNGRPPLTFDDWLIGARGGPGFAGPLYPASRRK